MALLEAAIGELNREEHPAKGTVLAAASLIREQIDQQSSAADAYAGGRLLAWQARRVLEYIDAHIAGPMRVGDLCALLQRSEAYFSRSFKRTFRMSPYAFVIRRRLQLAAQHMLETDSGLSDIALRCGFTDQAHLCKHFRESTGESPAAWRRARRALQIVDGVADLPKRGRALGPASSRRIIAAAESAYHQNRSRTSKRQTDAPLYIESLKGEVPPRLGRLCIKET
jgi:AraC-like DNA-binding protein